MSNSIIKPMLPYSEWLNNFLKDNINPLNYKKLFENAFELLNVRFEININKTFLSELFEEKQPLSPIRTLYPYQAEQKHAFYIDEMLSRKYGMIELFKLINSSSLDWRENLSNCITNLAIDTDNGFRNGTFYTLMQSYGNIADTIIVAKGMIKKSKIFHIEGLSYPSAYINKAGFEVLPTTTVLSQMFFNFLLNGGQTYFSFCNHCNNFFTTQRKIKLGSKRFCSDICRAFYYQDPKRFKKK